MRNDACTCDDTAAISSDEMTDTETCAVPSAEVLEARVAELEAAGYDTWTTRSTFALRDSPVLREAFGGERLPKKFKSERRLSNGETRASTVLQRLEARWFSGQYDGCEGPLVRALLAADQRRNALEGAEAHDEWPLTSVISVDLGFTREGELVSSESAVKAYAVCSPFQLLLELMDNFSSRAATALTNYGRGRLPGARALVRVAGEGALYEGFSMPLGELGACMHAIHVDGDDGGTCTLRLDIDGAVCMTPTERDERDGARVQALFEQGESAWLARLAHCFRRAWADCPQCARHADTPHMGFVKSFGWKPSYCALTDVVFARPVEALAFISGHLLPELRKEAWYKEGVVDESIYGNRRSHRFPGCAKYEPLVSRMRPMSVTLLEGVSDAHALRAYRESPSEFMAVSIGITYPRRVLAGGTRPVSGIGAPLRKGWNGTVPTMAGVKRQLTNDQLKVLEATAKVSLKNAMLDIDFEAAYGWTYERHANAKEATVPRTVINAFVITKGCQCAHLATRVDRQVKRARVMHDATARHRNQTATKMMWQFVLGEQPGQIDHGNELLQHCFSCGSTTSKVYRNVHEYKANLRVCMLVPEAVAIAKPLFLNHLCGASCLRHR